MRWILDKVAASCIWLSNIGKVHTVVVVVSP